MRLQITRRRRVRAETDRGEGWNRSEVRLRSSKVMDLIIISILLYLNIKHVAVRAGYWGDIHAGEALPCGLQEQPGGGDYVVLRRLRAHGPAG